MATPAATRTRGIRHQNWIEGLPADQPNTIPLSALTWDQLVRTGPSTQTLVDYDVLVKTDARSLGLLSNVAPHWCVYANMAYPLILNDLSCIVTRRAILITLMQRESGPHISEVLKAVYSYRYSINTIQHIYFDTVVEQATRNFITGVLWPNLAGYYALTRFEYRRGSAGYQGLLGTPLGRIVTCFILNSFGPGRYGVTRIVLFGVGPVIHLRFDIAPYRSPLLKPPAKRSFIIPEKPWDDDPEKEYGRGKRRKASGPATQDPKAPTAAKAA